MSNYVPSHGESAMILVRRIDRIIEQIPLGFADKERLVAELRKVQSAAIQHPHHRIVDRWEKASEILNKHIGEVGGNWVYKIWGIFSSNKIE
jgi:hypothetical protein